MRRIVTEKRSGIIQNDDQKHSELIFVSNNNHLEVVNTVSVFSMSQSSAACNSNKHFS